MCDRLARADPRHHLDVGGGAGQPQSAAGNGGVDRRGSVAWSAAATALISGWFRWLHLTDRNPAGAGEDGVGRFHGMAEIVGLEHFFAPFVTCLLYTSPSPRDLSTSRMPSSA